MDTPDLAPSFLSAGREYVERLSTLGMDVTMSMWAFDQITDEFVLLIVSDFFDVKGPLEVSKALFRAYDLSVTPKEIDPFKVRLHSDNHPFVDEITKFAQEDAYLQKVDKTTGKPIGEKVRYSGGTAGNLAFKLDWLVKSAKPVLRKPVEISRRWDRFVRNVEKAAA